MCCFSCKKSPDCPRSICCAECDEYKKCPYEKCEDCNPDSLEDSFTNGCTLAKPLTENSK